MGAWGYGLFQSDHDFDLVSDLTGEAGLYKLEEEAVEKAKAEGADEKTIRHISYSIYFPSDLEFVRQHLDSGVLAKMVQEKEAAMLAPPKEGEWVFNDPCYAYVLLGACAMSLGCHLPDSYISMLKKVYTEGGLMPDALKQMKKALFGPDGFTNGVPYDFESKDLVETANAMGSAPPSGRGWVGMNVIGPGGIFNTGMGDSSTSAVIKELRAKHNHPDACGGCGVEQGEEGTVLMQCARCKDRKYCSKDCQRKQWKIHKRVCEPADE
ncbi:hypothetical protein CC80DRAFT_578477 [Byssothecium circinans]|uniref:MYND-type domain-containing protein n=1 Tax=Byssothecium circinans TaxID=147558 RepID=A0A6A5TFM5_9PLEO|nr:hypothetical protein CC80DRAFT_578477 [Byssothecium circinans]